MLENIHVMQKKKKKVSATLHGNGLNNPKGRDGQTRLKKR